MNGGIREVPSDRNVMSDEKSKLIRQSYDKVADEYARRISNELEGKPFDRELLRRFATRSEDAARCVIWGAALDTWRAISRA
jgi:hypothetical protein